MTRALPAMKPPSYGKALVEARRTRNVAVEVPKSSARFPRVWLMEAQTDLD